MARLTKLHLKGWKSIRDAEIEFRNINVLVGGNGAGKSNLISFLELFSEIAESDLATYIAQQGGADSILHLGGGITDRIEASLGMEYAHGGDVGILTLMPLPGDRLGMIAGTIYYVEPAEGKNGVAKPPMKKEGGFGGRIPIGGSDGTRFRVRCYHFHNSSHPGPLQKSSEIDDNRVLRARGDNLAAMLYLYRERYVHAYRRIRAAVRAVSPTFDDFDLQTKRMNTEYVELRWRSRTGGNYSFGTHQTSDGLLRAIALFTVLLQPEADAPDLLVFDEPELGLHPAAISIFADLVKGAARKSQILIATQSPLLVDEYPAEAIITADVAGAATTFTRPDPETLAVWLQNYSLGELWTKGVIGAGPDR